MGLGRVIVVPLASPETAPWLGMLAGSLAAADDGTVVPVSVVTPDSSRSHVAAATTAVDAAVEAATGLGVQAVGRVVDGRQVSTAVLDAVDEHGASMVLMGWQGRSTPTNVFGELIDSVMGRSTVPLAVVRPSATPVDRVLLPVAEDHLLPGSERGLDLAARIAERLHDATVSPLLVLAAGWDGRDEPQPIAALRATRLALPDGLTDAVGQVARAGDAVVVSVPATGEGLRTVTTHLAWATPSSWQVVVIDVGPATAVDVVSAVSGAGMVIEPVADPTEEVPHHVEVTVIVDADAADPWPGVRNAVRLVGAVVSHERSTTDDGRQRTLGVVEVLAPDPGTALSAIMLELDDARWGLGPAEISYRLADR